MKVLLRGYVGHKNFGDDLLLDIAIKNLESIGINDFFVHIPPNVSDYSYINKYSKNITIIRSEKLSLWFDYKYDIIYYIGGGIHFDYRAHVTLKEFFKKLISNFIRHFVASLFGTKYVGMGLGLGPYNSKLGLWKDIPLLNSFSFLGVRDDKSFDFAKRCFLSSDRLFQTNDLSLKFIQTESRPKNSNPHSQEIIFCLRGYEHQKDFETYLNIVSDAIGELEKSFNIHLVLFQPENSQYFESIAKGNKFTVWNPEKQNFSCFFNMFRDADCIITSRMHAVYLAGIVGTPAIPIILHPKIQYAHELFYSKPLFVKPNDSYSTYIEAFKNRKEQGFSMQVAEKEEMQVNMIQALMNEIIKNK